MKSKNTYKLPSYIVNDEVKKYIESVVKSLKEKGLFENVDKLVLDQLAANYQILLDSYKNLNEYGLTKADRYGNIVASPYVAIKKNAEDVIAKITKEIGLSAKSRKALNTDNDDFGLEELLND